MVDYNDVFTEVADIVSAPTTRETGERECALTSGAWATTPQAQCDGCPAHLLEGGSHDTVGTHYIDANTVNSPIDINNTYASEVLRRAQTLLHLLQWIVGAESHNPAYVYNGGGYNNFATFFSWEVVGGSGKTLTLKVGITDPRSVVLSSVGVRDDETGVINYTDIVGAFCMPMDAVHVGGNSVLSGRVRSKIVSVNFGGISDPADPEDTFTITLLHDVSNVMTAYDPDDTEWKPNVTVYRDAYQPEQWVEPKVIDPRFFRRVTRTFEYSDAEWNNADHIITLNNPHTSADALCCWPFADYELPLGYGGISNLLGTFKLEKRLANGEFTDITSNLRVASSGEWIWPRFVVTHEAGNAYKTRLYLGDTDYFGNSQTALVTENDILRITYCYAVADSDKVTEEEGELGPFAPIGKSCRYDKKSYNSLSGISVNGVAANNYCALRDSLPAANVSLFRAGGCNQMSSCPGYRPPQPERVNEYVWGQLHSGQNECLKQLSPGNSHVTNFIHCRINVPSITWLLNPPEVYHSWHQFYGKVFPYSGGYVKVNGTYTDEDDNEFFDIIRGAFYNYAYRELNTLDWETNRSPAGMDGILPREISEVAKLPYNNQTASSVNDPTKDFRRMRIGRNPAVTVRDAYTVGGDFVYSTRNIPGMEAENRVQRFDRRTVMYVANVSLSTVNEDQPSDSRGSIEIFGSNKSYVGRDDIHAVITLRPDGKDYGYKRIGGTGLNGHIHRVENLGGNVFRIHAFIGLWIESTTVTGGDSLNAFWAGGNVVAAPYPYEPSASYYNDVHNKQVGSNQRKCCPGDVITFTSPLMANVSCMVKRAEPFAGDDLSEMQVQYWAVNQILEPFFDVSEVVAPKLGVTAYAITDIQPGIAPNYPPIITVEDHGLTTGDLIQIDNSNSDPSVDGVWTVIVLDEDTFVLLTANYDDSLVAGNTGQMYKYGEHDDDPTPEIVITNLEVKYVSGSYEYWYSLNNPAVENIAFENRPTTEISTEFNDQVLHWDRVVAPKLGVTAYAITDIQPGIAPNYPPIITVEDHGLTTGDLIQIDNSNSDPSVDGVWTVIVLDEDTFVLLTANYDDSLVAGNTGQMYKYGEDVIVQGSQNAYLSYAVYYWCFATSSGILNNQIRVSYTVNGVAQTPKIITIVPPQVDLGFNPDISAVSEWRVVLVDPRRFPSNPYQELTYKGLLANEFDLVNGPSFFEWCYDSANKKIILHPNTAGAGIYVFYKTTTPVDIGAMPTGVALPTSALSDITYLKKCDIIDVYEPSGYLAGLTLANLAGTGFYVSTGGVLDPEQSVVLKVAQYQTETWVTIPSNLYTVIHATGKIYLHDDAIAWLPQRFCLRVEGGFVNRTQETPAMLLKNLVNCLGCLDTIQAGISSNGGTTLSVYAPYQPLIPLLVSTDGWTKVADVWYMQAASSWKIGTYNERLPLVNTHPDYDSLIYGILQDEDAAPLMVVNEFSGFGEDQGFLNAGIQIGVAETGLNTPFFGAKLTSDLWLFTLGEELSKIPSSTEIDDAWIEVALPEDTVLRHSYVPVKYTNLMYSYTVASGFVYGNVAPLDPEYAVETDIVEFELGFGLLGQTNDGDWVGLGTFKDAIGSITVKAGKTRVVKVKALVEFLLSQRDSVYKQFALMPTSIGVGAFEEAIPVHPDFRSIIPLIVAGYTKVTDLGTNGKSATDPEFEKYCAVETWSMQMGTLPQLSNLHVKFKLPSSVLDTVRLTYGNFPTMQPIT